MGIKATCFGTLAFAALAASSVGAQAETAKAKSIGMGAQVLSADQIAQRFAGMTLTFVRADNKRFLIHYGANNVVSGRIVGGKWSDTGYYGITNADSICLSWKKSDKGRLRCFSVLVMKGVVKKFNPDGTFAGEIAKFERGKSF